MPNSIKISVTVSNGHHGFCCSGGGAIINQVPVEDMVESVWLQGWLSPMVDPDWSWSLIEAEADSSLLQLFLGLELGESKSATKDNVGLGYFFWL